jgi:hypothetical protein
METEKINIRKAFDEVFGVEDKYFGEWFVKANADLTAFLESLRAKEIFFKQLRYLYLYLEALEILKTQSKSKDFSVAQLMSRDAWYCTVLLMLVGLIDQHTKHEVTKEGNLKRLKDRFQIVLRALNSDEQRDFTLHYNGSRFKNINDLSAHLYETRTFFAHDVVMPKGGVPQDRFLGVDSKNIGTMFINMPHGRIFLLLVISLLRYLGFNGQLDISSNKKFDSFADMLRDT